MTTHERAREYAEGKICKAFGIEAEHISMQIGKIPKFSGRDLLDAHEAGATEALAGLWRNVENDGYPKPKDYRYDLFGNGGVFVLDLFLLWIKHKDGFTDVCTANFKVEPNGDKVWDYQDGFFETQYSLGEFVVTHWMPIQQPKDTNA